MTDEEVFERLDYTAGSPSPSAQRALAITLAAATFLAMGVVVLFRSGLITPRLGWPRESAGWAGQHGPGHLGFTVPVENHGLFPVTIVGIGESLPGFELEPPLQGALPVILEAGKQIDLRVAYRVSDCAAFERLVSVPVRIQRSWGVQIGRVAFPDVKNLRCQTPSDQS